MGNTNQTPLDKQQKEELSRKLKTAEERALEWKELVKAEKEKAQNTDDYRCALAGENVEKNRYQTDITRVRLSSVYGASDYINANYVDGTWPNAKKAYIAAQAPKPETFKDFWRMVWEQNVHSIVMLTNLEEKGKLKAHQYWPKAGTKTFGNISVTLGSVTEYEGFCVREFVIRMGKGGGLKSPTPATNNAKKVFITPVGGLVASGFTPTLDLLNSSSSSVDEERKDHSQLVPGSPKQRKSRSQRNSREYDYDEKSPKSPKRHRKHETSDDADKISISNTRVNRQSTSPDRWKGKRKSNSYPALPTFSEEFIKTAAAKREKEKLNQVTDNGKLGPNAFKGSKRPTPSSRTLKSPPKSPRNTPSTVSPDVPTSPRNPSPKSPRTAGVEFLEVTVQDLKPKSPRGGGRQELTGTSLRGVPIEKIKISTSPATGRKVKKPENATTCGSDPSPVGAVQFLGDADSDRKRRTKSRSKSRDRSRGRIGEEDEVTAKETQERKTKDREGVKGGKEEDTRGRDGKDGLKHGGVRDVGNDDLKREGLRGGMKGDRKTALRGVPVKPVQSEELRKGEGVYTDNFVEQGEVNRRKTWQGDKFGKTDPRKSNWGGDGIRGGRSFQGNDDEEGEVRYVVQYHYTNWPDMDVPEGPGPMLEMLKQIEERREKMEKEGKIVSLAERGEGESLSPLLVHCSAGIGRTGTFCVIHSILNGAKESKLDLSTMSLRALVTTMRDQRPGFVQQKCQYLFCYRVIRFALTGEDETPLEIEEKKGKKKK